MSLGHGLRKSPGCSKVCVSSLAIFLALRVSSYIDEGATRTVVLFEFLPAFQFLTMGRPGNEATVEAAFIATLAILRGGRTSSRVLRYLMM